MVALATMKMLATCWKANSFCRAISESALGLAQHRFWSIRTAYCMSLRLVWKLCKVGTMPVFLLLLFFICLFVCLQMAVS